MRLGRNKVDECGSTAGFIWTKRLWVLLLSMVSLVMIGGIAVQANSETVLEVSSYFGGATDGETMRDICIDRDGFIYLAVTTGSWDLPTNTSSWDPEYNDGKTDRYRGDIYIAKLDPTDRSTVWSTYLGGPGIDEVYGIAVDRQGNVVLSGRASDKFPVTPGAFQTTFMGPFEGRGGPHGPGQDAFIARFDADGQLIWASYFGSSDGYDTGRDIAVDENGDIYLAAHYKGTGDYPPEVAQAFLNSPLGGTDSVIAKISSDGSRVLWARYLGGSGNAGENSVKVDTDGNPIFLDPDTSSDAYTTPDAYDRTYNGNGDWYMVKLTPDGKTFIYATYIGGSKWEGTETNSLVVDSQGRAIISGATNSPDYPITPGAFDGSYGGGIDRSNWPGDACISILSADGSQLLASTYYGGSGGDGGEGVAVDAQGNVYISGGAYSTDLTVTPDAFQKEHKGDLDAFVAKFSPDLTQLLYASYLGGTKTDYARCMDAGPNGVFVIGGQTTSSDLPTVNPLRGSLGDVLDTMLAIFR